MLEIILSALVGEALVRRPRRFARVLRANRGILPGCVAAEAGEDDAPMRASRGRSALILAAALAAIALLGWTDVVTGPDWGLSIFYLMPIVACGWWAGRRAALVAAIAGAAAWLGADLAAQAHGRELVSLWNGTTRLVIFVFVGTSVAASRRDRQRLAELLARSEAAARTDPLTGLANARAFYERLEAELSRLSRTGAPLCVAYVDLDNFKKVNDRFGHAGGDDCLRRVASLLREEVRAGDVVARLGGDEIAIALWESTAKGAEQCCERIVERVRGLRRDYPGTDIGASAGIAWFARAPTRIDDVVAAADEAMYAAKRAGKGRVVLVDGEAVVAAPSSAVSATLASTTGAPPS